MIKAPEFCLPNQDETEICLRDLAGKWVVLYFYPKDNTPGCTTEACDFSNELEEFEDLDAVILGVSPDSPKKHRNFNTPPSSPFINILCFVKSDPFPPVNTATT
jgi:peroxiredoxin Q/BCP